VVYLYGLDRMVLDNEKVFGIWGRIAWSLQKLLFWRDLTAPRGQRLREALESLGPIFVKFGQMLSTRRDLMPVDLANELAKLQDQVAFYF